MMKLSPTGCHTQNQRGIDVLYLIFQIIWAVFGLFLFSAIFVITMLWGDKLLEKVTGVGLFELVEDILRRFTEG